MSIIKFNQISKEFKISIREKGVWGAIKGLFKRKYKIVNALKNVSFEVNEGDIVGYIGPNGAGKSTTIKIMSGILNPTSGECEIDGYIPWKNRKEYVKNIGVVFGQRSQLWWDVPIIESFELLKDIYKIPNDTYKQNLELLCKTLSLDELLMRPLRQLSLGQKMKCELAGALLHKPKILFLDEPTIGSVKTIKVKFSNAIENIELDGYDVISHDKNTAVLKNKEGTTFHAKDFISKLSEKYDVVDFSVEPISVDEVLAHLYKDYNL